MHCKKSNINTVAEELVSPESENITITCNKVATFR